MKSRTSCHLAITTCCYVASIAAFLLLASVSVQAQQSLKMATVDMQSLFKDFNKTAVVQNMINVERGKIQELNKERTDVIAKKKDEMKAMYEKMNDPGMSEPKKQELYKQLQAMNQEGMALEKDRVAYIERRNTALNEMMVVRMKEIVSEIREKVTAHAKSKGYNLVLDKEGLSTSQVPLVLFSDIEDLTDVLLTEINKGAPADGKKPESAPAKVE